MMKLSFGRILAALCSACFFAAGLGAEGLKFEDHISMSEEYLSDSQHQEAMDSAKEAAALDGESPLPWALMGRAQEGLGRKKEALKSYEQGLELGLKGQAAKDARARVAALESELGIKKEIEKPAAVETPAVKKAETPVAKAEEKAEEPEKTPQKTAVPVKAAEEKKEPQKARAAEGSFSPKRFTVRVGSFLGFETWFDQARDLASGNPADKVLGFTGSGSTIDVSDPKRGGDFPANLELGYDHWVLEFSSVSYEAVVRYQPAPAGNNPDSNIAVGRSMILGAGYDWAFFSRRSGSPADFEIYLPARLETIIIDFTLGKYNTNDTQIAGSAGLGLRWFPLQWLAVDGGATIHQPVTSTDNFDFGDTRTGNIPARGYMVKFGLVGLF